MFSTMESDSLGPAESLKALEQTREQNVQRLRKPLRYWIMLGCMLGVFALVPLTREWPGWLQLTAPPVLILVMALIFAWRQPPARYRMQLRGRMLLPLLALIVVMGAVSGFGSALYIEHGHWWIPALGALLLFALVVIAGPSMERWWAKEKSSIDF